MGFSWRPFRAPPFSLVSVLVVLSVLLHPTNGKYLLDYFSIAKNVYCAVQFFFLTAAVTYISPITLTVNQAAGITVALEATTDIPGDNITFELVPPSSSLFSISGDMLTVAPNAPLETFFVFVSIVNMHGSSIIVTINYYLLLFGRLK